jgi:hypothetical protein
VQHDGHDSTASIAFEMQLRIHYLAKESIRLVGNYRERCLSRRLCKQLSITRLHSNDDAGLCRRSQSQEARVAAGSPVVPEYRIVVGNIVYMPAERRIACCPGLANGREGPALKFCVGKSLLMGSSHSSLPASTILWVNNAVKTLLIEPISSAILASTDNIGDTACPAAATVKLII